MMMARKPTKADYDNVSNSIMDILFEYDPEYTFSLIGYTISELFDFWHRSAQEDHANFDVKGFADQFCATIQRNIATVTLGQVEQ